jgi:hypothetical protein
MTSLNGPHLLQPGETIAVRVQVHLLECDAIGGLPDWARSLTLQVGRRGESFEASAGEGTRESYPLPDVLLLAAGAAIQKECRS